jgi:hypothetical protein
MSYSFLSNVRADGKYKCVGLYFGVTFNWIKILTYGE